MILYRLIKYRQKIVNLNLKNSFPTKSDREINEIEQLFYHHFCDIMIESVKLFSIGNKELNLRNKILNPEVLNELFDKGKSVIVCAGHYNNWEMGGTTCCTQIKHHVVGIYAPLSNSFFNQKFLQSRGKFGLELLSKKVVKEGFEKNKNLPSVYLFATDQSPTHSKTVHWTHFLNQPTAVLVGAERFAKEYDCPVVYIYVTKVKRGYYELEFKVLEAEPIKTLDGAITEKHTQWLEKQINETPQYWLWTHKRWKRKMTGEDEFYLDEKPNP